MTLELLSELTVINFLKGGAAILWIILNGAEICCFNYVHKSFVSHLSILDQYVAFLNVNPTLCCQSGRIKGIVFSFVVSAGQAVIRSGV